VAAADGRGAQGAGSALSSLLASLPEAAILTDGEGRIAEWNPAAEGLLGLAASATVGRRLEEVLGSKAPSSCAEIHAAVKRRGAWQGECIVATRGGGELSVEIRAGVAPAGGDPAGMLLTLRDNSRIVHALQALQESEARFRSIVEMAPEAIFLADASGRFIEVNGAACSQLGYTREQLLGMTVSEVVAPAHRAHAAALLQQMQKRPMCFESCHLAADGSEVPVELAVRGLLFQGRPVLVGIARDVRASRRAESLQSAVYAIAEAAAEVHELGDLFPRIHRIIGGLMPARNLYFTLYDRTNESIFFPYFVDEKDTLPSPATRPLGKGVTEYVLRTGRPLLTDEQGLTELSRRGELEPLGTPCVSWLGVPLKIGEEVIGAMVVQSYTEGEPYTPEEQGILEYVSRQVAMAIRRRRAEDALRESEEKYRFLAENASDVIWQMDAHFRFTYVSSSVQALLGHTKGEVLGRSLFEFLRPQTREQIERLAAARDREGQQGPDHQPSHYEVQMCHKSGRDVWVEVSVTPRVDAAGGLLGYYGVTRDIGERKRAEAERVSLEERLRQAQKMESVGRLAGGIAHDFNNLLLPILGYAEMMLQELPEGAPLSEMTKQVQHAAERARDLTKQLLAFSRKQVLELKTIDLGKVVAGFQSILRRTIREDIDMQIQVPPGPALVRADAGQMEQVLMNLAINAQDAMPQGGQLNIEVEAVELPGDFPSRPSAAVPGPYVRLQISDTGVGMAGEVLEHLFEPFFTTKRPGEATGLGLSTVYGIVKQHGGEIEVASQASRGTTFRIYLPRLAERETQEVPAEEREPASHRGTETILLVEDNEAVRDLTEAMLRRRGYGVLACAGGEEALAVSRAQDSPIDLLITDVIMPGMTGKELAARLSRERGGLKVLFISGYAQEVIADHGVLEAGIHFVAKPFTTEALWSKVREVLDGPGP
jgi:two-component system cell cycle sensor histidine kinase/response regulator CckA